LGSLGLFAFSFPISSAKRHDGLEAKGAIFDIQVWLIGILSSENPTGTYHFTLVFDMPEGSSEKLRVALHKNTD
jgi:hypothetical protein